MWHFVLDEKLEQLPFYQCRYLELHDNTFIPSPCDLTEICCDHNRFINIHVEPRSVCQGLFFFIAIGIEQAVMSLSLVIFF